MKLEIGQPVKVVMYRGKVLDGRVVKIARTWVTIAVDQGGYENEFRFRMDDRTDGSDWPDRFYTLDQWAEKVRRDEALTFLREQGVYLESSSPWRGREETLAELIRVAVPE
jgi:hypothetical protein